MDTLNAIPTTMGFWDRIMSWLHGSNTPATAGAVGGEMLNPTGDADQGDRLQTLDRVNAALPAALSGRDAVLNQRKRLQLIDDQLRDAER